jgi:magnesium transporter
MQALTRFDPEAMRAARDAGEYFWLDLVEPDDATIIELGEVLDWHPLLVEDLIHGNQRPKVEDFTDHVLVVCYGVTIPTTRRESLRAVEHLAVVHGDYFVTVRQRGLDALGELCDTMVGGTDGMSEGGLVHRVLDEIVDSGVEAAHDVQAEVTALEEAIDHGANERVLARLRALRRYVTELQGLALAQRDALVTIGDALEQIPGFEVGLRTHFRDVADHARRTLNVLDVSSRLLDAAVEAYYTMLVARQGEIAQRLTVIATIFLPLTFVTGFFGQNFGWMVRNVSSERDFLVFGVGTTVLCAAALAVVFKRLRWY